MAATQASHPSVVQMDQSPPSKHIFSFFELPAELREMVYESLQRTYDHIDEDAKTNKAIKAPGNGDEELNNYSIRMIPPRFRQISKQFKDEIEAHMRKTTTFVFEECHSECYALGIVSPPNLPSMVTESTTQVLLKLHAWCTSANVTGPKVCGEHCGAIDDIDAHQSYMGVLLEDFSGLKSCEIELRITCAVDDEEAWPESKHGEELRDS